MGLLMRKENDIFWDLYDAFVTLREQFPTAIEALTLMQGAEGQYGLPTAATPAHP